jgi:hypothetical protein
MMGIISRFLYGLSPQKSEERMDSALKQFVKDICLTQSKSLVGKICKQIEVLQAQPNLSNETKQTLDLLKSLNKELIYEQFRDLKNGIVFYAEGREYTKYPIFTPTKEAK